MSWWKCEVWSWVVCHCRGLSSGLVPTVCLNFIGSDHWILYILLEMLQPECWGLISNRIRSSWYMRTKPRAHKPVWFLSITIVVTIVTILACHCHFLVSEAVAHCKWRSLLLLSSVMFLCSLFPVIDVIVVFCCFLLLLFVMKNGSKIHTSRYYTNKVLDGKPFGFGFLIYHSISRHTHSSWLFILQMWETGIFFL